MQRIRAFYSRFTGRFSHMMTLPVLEPARVRKRS